MANGLVDGYDAMQAAFGRFQEFQSLAPWAPFHPRAMPAVKGQSRASWRSGEAVWRIGGLFVAGQPDLFEMRHPTSP
jgi:hypothetical protein